jgi:hypothetical protein
MLVPPNDERWLHVLAALSWRAEWVVDHRADAHAVLGITAKRAIDAILEASGSRSPNARGIIAFRLANFLGWGTGELDEAEAACGRARALFEQAGDRAAALLAENERAWIRGLRGDYPAMERPRAGSRPRPRRRMNRSSRSKGCKRLPSPRWRGVGSATPSTRSSGATRSRARRARRTG